MASSSLSVGRAIPNGFTSERGGAYIKLVNASPPTWHSPDHVIHFLHNGGHNLMEHLVVKYVALHGHHRHKTETTICPYCAVKDFTDPWVCPTTKDLPPYLYLPNLNSLEVTGCATTFVRVLPSLVLNGTKLRNVKLSLEEDTCPLAMQRWDVLGNVLNEVIDDGELGGFNLWFYTIFDHFATSRKQLRIAIEYIDIKFGHEVDCRSWGAVEVTWQDGATWKLQYSAKRRSAVVGFLHGTLLTRIQDRHGVALGLMRWFVEVTSKSAREPYTTKKLCGNQNEWRKRIQGMYIGEEYM